MINLEQIQSLNIKVQKALDVIVTLREENGTLRTKLSDYEKRMEELEVLVNSFSNDQDDIENGILDILQQLDKLEEDFSSKEENAAPEVKSASSEEISNEASEIPEKVAAEEETVEKTDIRDPESPMPPVETTENPPEEPQKQQASSDKPVLEKTEPEAELDIF